jgi:hypothetical protein
VAARRGLTALGTKSTTRRVSIARRSLGLRPKEEINVKQSFIVTIPIRDRDGHVVGEKQVVKYEGLLARAHEDGLRSIHTELLQVPTKTNGDTAIVRAVVVTGRGTFEGIGDAAPGNVNARVTGHLLRVAETRAKARALRDAVNIGLVALEELDEVEVIDVVAEPPKVERTAPPAPANGNAPTEPRDDLMTQAQRRLLFRIAAERGVATDDIARWLEDHTGLKDIRTWSKVDASRLIERLKNQNGHAPAVPS